MSLFSLPCRGRACPARGLLLIPALPQHAPIQLLIYPGFIPCQIYINDPLLHIHAAEQCKADCCRKNGELRRRDRLEHPHQRQHRTDSQHKQAPCRREPPGRQGAERHIDSQLARCQRSKSHAEPAEHGGQRFGQRRTAKELYARQHRKIEQQDFQQFPKAVHRKSGGVRCVQPQRRSGEPLPCLHGKEQRIDAAQRHYSRHRRGARHNAAVFQHSGTLLRRGGRGFAAQGATHQPVQPRTHRE